MFSGCLSVFVHNTVYACRCTCTYMCLFRVWPEAFLYRLAIDFIIIIIINITRLIIIQITIIFYTVLQSSTRTSMKDVCTEEGRTKQRGGLVTCGHSHLQQSCQSCFDFVTPGSLLVRIIASIIVSCFVVQPLLYHLHKRDYSCIKFYEYWLHEASTIATGVILTVAASLICIQFDIQHRLKTTENFAQCRTFCRFPLWAASVQEFEGSVYTVCFTVFQQQIFYCWIILLIGVLMCLDDNPCSTCNN